MKDRLAKGALWVAGTRVLVNLISFASTILLARLLVPADFGIVAIATTVSAFVTATTELSLASALVQHRDPQDHHFDTAWTMGVIRSIVIAGVIALLSRPAAALYGQPQLREALFAIAAMTALAGLNSPKMVMFTRNLIFWQDFAIGVSTRVASFIVSIAIAYFYRSFWALLAGMAVAQLLGLLLSYVLAPYLPRFRLVAWRELLSYSVWLSLGQLVNTINWRSDPLLIGYFLGPTKLGFYAFGDRLAQLPTNEATAPISATLFPAFSRLANDKIKLRAAFQKAQTLLSAVALPFGIGFALIAEPMVRIMIGEKWLPTVVVIQALASIYALQTMGSAVHPLAMAMGKTRQLFERDVLNMLIRLPIIITGAALGGLVGVVYARIGSGLIGLIINLVLLRRLLNLTLRDQLLANWRSLCSVGAMAAGIISLRGGSTEMGIGTLGPVLTLLLLLVVGASLYVGTAVLLWLASGRPDGPERAILELAAAILSQKKNRFG